MMNLKFFGKNVFFLHLFAQYRPEPHWPFIVKILYYLVRVCCYICFTITVVCSIISVVLDDGEHLAENAVNIVNTLIYGSIALRNIHFVYNSKVVEHLITRMNLVMRESSVLAFEPYTMTQGRTVSNRMHNSWNLFAIGAGMGMALSPFFKRTHELPLNYWLFYDWTDEKYYMATLIFQTVSQIFMVSCFANIEMFNACFTILLRYQFKVLGVDFQYVFPNALHKVGMNREDIESFMKNRNKYVEFQYKYREEIKIIYKQRNSLKTRLCFSPHLIKRIEMIAGAENFQKEVLNNFKYCIKQHQDMVNFRDEFYEFISFQLGSELFFLMAYLIFTLFTVTITDDPAIYFALSQYFGGTVTQIYMMCIFGEKLTTEVDNLRDILHDIPWYFGNKEFRKNFLIVQMRMTKNYYLKAILLNISLETFVDFLKNAASYFAVLRQVNEV